jgi:very-short-patch-repair endonuclease
MPQILAHCTHCQQVFLLTKKWQRDGFKKGNNLYCSDGCRTIAVSRRSSETMARTNRKYASARMKANNPMHKEASKQKMKATLHAIGHAPKVRGGNGQGPTLPQQALAQALGWQMEYVVKTHVPKINPQHLPTSYKLDLADPIFKIAIEVDGKSHLQLERKAQDRKKEQVLNGFGWTILRFTNQEVMEHLQECVQTVQSTILKLKTITPTSPTDL